ncbi:MAG: phospholipid carrier-dependent glycosyltransferase [Methanophagales archaeon ANME-1-THS]|nr:MAG: phospholipid carrier-dependent glycosyltransferase [Methanophagales archaeon ANME-1-THS]
MYRIKGINWWEIGAITALTILFLACATINLGSFAIPSSAWQPSPIGIPSSEEETHLVFDLGSVQQVKEIYLFLGDEKRTNLKVYGGTTPDNVELIASYDNDPARHVHFCSWERISVGNKSCRFITFVVGNESEGKIGELVFVSAANKKIVPVAVTGFDAQRFVDEQDLIQLPITQKYGAYFDEMYFVRTAQQHLKLEEPYEWTHPPLGKLIIALGILMFGMNPFGWRILGVLAAAAMIPLLFIFGKRIFKSSVAGFIAAGLMTFDFMHFSLARLATGEIYLLLFSLLMFYFAFEYFSARQAEGEQESGGGGKRKPETSLLISMLFFGLGFAVKWIAVFGLIALVILVPVHNRRARRPILSDVKIIGAGLFASAALYIATYIPYMFSGGGHALIDIHRVPLYLQYLSEYLSGGTVSPPPTPLTVFDLQLTMFGYHAGITATHPFSSPWWSWPLMLKPLWMYTNSFDSTVSTIVLMGNPALWWGSIPALIGVGATVVTRLLKKTGAGYNFVFLFMLIPFLIQWLPYTLITRVLFIYHFASTVPFMILAVTYWLHLALTWDWSSPRRTLLFKSLVVGFLVLNVVLFILFYPVLSGYPISYAYKEWLRWLSGWTF